MLSSTALVAVAAFVPLVASHAAFWTPAMWGFNVTAQSYDYDNRPVVPLQDMTYQQWWFHNHLDHPPNPGDFFELPAGGVAHSQISCDKGSTSYFASSPGGKAGYPTNDVCVGQPMSAYHTNGLNDLGGCGLGIVYKSDVNQVQPEDFTIFSVNATCPFYLNTDFSIPPALPACPEGGCICAFFWIHKPDSGQEQMYMNGFRCQVTGASGTTPIGKPALPRRCGADPANGVANATPSNCTVGPKQPFYWLQKERNNMFEGVYSPPLYADDLYFHDGAQNDIFQPATVNGVAVYSDQGASTPPPSTPPPPPPPPPSEPAPSNDAPAPPPKNDAPAPNNDAPAPNNNNNSPGPQNNSAAPVNNDSPPAAQNPPPTPANQPPPANTFAASNPDPTAATQAPSTTKQCKSTKRKRNVNAARHVKRRLSHDLH
ncbi:hypothetical protein BXZ70DRAFT_126304 [Cristinia sonorae]|uniref:Uncharacterized protein n=1 Tax=Cristinia sonorae TaxID=1940300 RepID=A0A8K0XPX5_9AGAR|nr:hypothetical protein BXZ70DRAFT_126304 [Cristinia sonorae]